MWRFCVGAQALNRAKRRSPAPPGSQRRELSRLRLGLHLSFLCLITPLCPYLHGGLYGRLYERAHIIRYLFCPEVFEFDDATGELTELQARLSVFCSLFSSQFLIGSVNLRANFSPVPQGPLGWQQVDQSIKAYANSLSADPGGGRV